MRNIKLRILDVSVLMEAVFVRQLLVAEEKRERILLVILTLMIT